MNILLVGNGFDLAHGLPTSYKSFLEFLEILGAFQDSPRNFPKTVTVQTTDLYKNYEDFQNFFQNPDLGKDERIKETLSLMKGNFWRVYFHDFFLNPFSRQSRSNWVDLERGIADVVKYLENPARPLNFTSTDVHKIDEMLDKTRTPKIGDTSALANRLYEDLEKFVRCFEIYLCICQEVVEITERLKCVDEIEPIGGLLSFNYTDTFEQRYRLYGSSCYIHGKAKADNTVESNNMVLGMDEYLSNSELKNEVDFIMFRKSCQRIFKRTDYTYKKWPNKHWSWTIDGRREWDNKLYIIGHSLDVTDKDVLNELILAPHMETTIYYHSRAANARQIANLVRVLGPDNLNRIARGGDDEGRSIQFKELK